MKKLLLKLLRIDMRLGISERDALSAAWSKLRHMLLLMIIVFGSFAVFASFSLIPRNYGEYCDAQGGIHSFLDGAHEDWLAYFSYFEAPPRNHVVYPDGSNYIIYSPQRNAEGRPIMVVITQQTVPQSEYGMAGYIYTSEDSLNLPLDAYDVQQLSPHIYCYQPINLLSQFRHGRWQGFPSHQAQGH